MSIEAASEPAQKPVVSYRSLEWADLRAGAGGINSTAVEGVVAHTLQRAAEPKKGNGQSEAGSEKQGTPLVAKSANHCSQALQEVRNLIAARMHSLRPGPRPSFREADRHGELKRILALAEIGAAPGELLFALCNSRHKGTRSFGRRISVNDGNESVTFQPECTTIAAQIQEMIGRTDALLDLLDPNDEPELGSTDTAADRAYAQADDRLFDPPPETADESASVKVA